MYSRADDARARLRRRPGFRLDHAHRRDLAGVPDHPRRPDAPRRAVRRRGDRVPGRADRASSARTPAPRSSWYTYTADLPAVVPARQDAAARPARGRAAPARRRVQPARRFHDTLLARTARCRSASTGGCWTASGAAAGPGRARRCRSSRRSTSRRGRSRIVYWPGASAGIGAPTDRPERIAERFVGHGRAAHPPRRLRRRPDRRAGQPRGRRRDRGARRRPAPGRRRRRSRRRRSGSRSPPARRGSC